MEKRPLDRDEGNIEICYCEITKNPLKIFLLHCFSFEISWLLFSNPDFLSLRKKYPYSELFWSVFSRILTEYGDIRSISQYSVQMRENTDQNNYDYGHFSRSLFL